MSRYFSGTLLIQAAILGGLSYIAHAARLRVPDQFQDLQAALNGCGVGDTVLVSPGTYNGQFVLPARTMTLMSEFELSGDSLDWLECRLNGDRGGCVLTTSTSTGDSVTISGFVIENGYGEYQIQSNSGGLTIRDGIHLNVRHLVFQNNEQSPGLSRGRSIFGSSSSSSARLQDIRIQSDSLTNGLEQVALWMGRGLEIDRLWIDGTHDQGRAAHLDGDPLRVRHMQVRGYSDVPQFWVKFGSDGIMDLDDVLIRDNSATGDFQVFAGPRFRAPSVRGFVFEGNQH
ncbi:MAG: hypothetical protein KDC10_16445, partial [Calditrichaeota bacterium]|nr:hypothetical protein [Calditrichota bacterium]